MTNADKIKNLLFPVLTLLLGLCQIISDKIFLIPGIIMSAVGIISIISILIFKIDTTQTFKFRVIALIISPIIWILSWFLIIITPVALTIIFYVLPVMIVIIRNLYIWKYAQNTLEMVISVLADPMLYLAAEVVFAEKSFGIGF